jgi:predicted secreted protein
MPAPHRSPEHPQRRRVAARRLLAALAAPCFSLALLPDAAPAAEPAAGAPLLRLEAQAQREVTEDVAVAVFFVERDGAQPDALQAAVNPVLQAALADLKRDPALQVRSGRYLTQPRYGREGRIEGWRVRAELVAESEDIAAVSKATSTLAGRMNVGSIGFRLSDAKRRQAEGALTDEAAAQLYERARGAARALGFAGVELVEANLSSGGSAPVPVMRAAMAQGAAAAEGAPVPLEPGRTTVTVGIHGTLRLTGR